MHGRRYLVRCLRIRSLFQKLRLNNSLSCTRTMPGALSRFMTALCWKVSSRKRKTALLLICLVLAISCAPELLCAQFTDPHAYDNTPVGLNELELVYAYAHSDASIDSSLVITGAHVRLNQGSLSYTRYFGFIHRLAWVQGTLPVAAIDGSITGTSIQGSESGMGDSSFEIGGLFKGGAALNIKEFEKFKPTTTLGASLIITAPTGLYNSEKVLNLGSYRWSFKPEIALSHPFGNEEKWQFDTYANVYFFTSNASYHGVELLRQQPLPGIEGHISYSFLDRLWASLDTRYSFRGATSVNGLNQNDSQQNFSLGTEVNLCLNARNALVFVFDKALVHQNGPSLAGFAVKYNYTWGKGYD